MDAQSLLQLLHDGGLTVYPLGVGSIVCLAILCERMWRYAGVDERSRDLTKETVDKLIAGDVDGAKALCQEAKTPLGEIFVEALRWKNVALEDLERVLATSRQEAASGLRKGLWLVGTIGSLAPYVGLFGTVVGIIKAFQDMAEHGAGGFEVVAAGISEALVATAAGLVVAIVALSFFNYLQVRVQALNATLSRCCERFVQAIVYVEAAAVSGSTNERAGDAPGMEDGSLVHAG